MSEKYETQNLYEASYLMTKGLKLSGKIDEGRKVTILFDDWEDSEKGAVEFYNGGKANAKTLFDNYRTLKDYVFTR